MSEFVWSNPEEENSPDRGDPLGFLPHLKAVRQSAIGIMLPTQPVERWVSFGNGGFPRCISPHNPIIDVTKK